MVSALEIMPVLALAFMIVLLLSIGCANSFRKKPDVVGARKFFHIPSALSDDTLIDNSFARRVDALAGK